MSEAEESKREAADIDVNALMDADLEVTGADIPEGAYPATLMGFSDAFKIPTSEKFRKPGQPEKRTVFEARFAVYDKQGSVQEVDYLLPIPEGGAANRKSNLYKMLRTLDPKRFTKEGAFTKGSNLKAFLGSNCVLNVKLNDKEWPQVDSIGSKIDELKYPTEKEYKPLLEKAGSDVSF